MPGRDRSLQTDLFLTAAELATEKTIEQLTAQNEAGWSVYIAMQPFKTGSGRRLKDNVAAVRRAFIDVDDDADAAYQKILTCGLVPEPHYVLETSPGKMQLVWNVEPMSIEELESLQAALIENFNGDPKCKDVAHVLRLPGFLNTKKTYAPHFPVVQIKDEPIGEATPYPRSAFNIVATPKTVTKKSTDFVPDTQFDALKVRVGWWPLIRRINALPDARLHITGDFAPGTLHHCPFHEHMNWTPQFGPIADNPLVVHCLGKCPETDSSWDVVGAVRKMDNLPSMEAAARRICEEEGLKYEEYFPHKPVLMGGVDITKKPVVEVADNGPVELPPSLLESALMPESALASTVLGNLYADKFAPAGFPLDLAVPALVTAASVLIPPVPPPPSGLIIRGDDAMVNLYTALIGPIHCGKSSAIDWATKALHIWRSDWGLHYLEGKWGSAEQLLKYLQGHVNNFREALLINPDEWSHLFEKAGIPNASFPSILTTAYYRRRHNITIQRKEISLNLALSFIAGIVEDQFDMVFGASTLGGVYDRFLFGRAPDDFMWDYQPYPYEILPENPYKFVPVKSDGSVFEVIKLWNKKDKKLGRIVEMCSRIATIYASIDGRRTLYGQDLEKLWGLASYQSSIRDQFTPNAGINPDAQFANAAINWLKSHSTGQWVNISALKNGTHAYEMQLGPNVVERALASMARGGRIDLWLATDRNGNPIDLPHDFTGKRPKIGLVRLLPV